MTLNFGENLFPPRWEMFVNYDYYDISEGVGYRLYYATISNGSETILTPNIVYSDCIHYPINNTAGRIDIGSGGSYRFDEDFDVTFNMQKVIKGRLFASVPIGLYKENTNGVENVLMYATIEIFHYDGTTETSLGSASSRSFRKKEFSPGTAVSSRAMVMIDVAKTNFKKGETLRINVKGFYQAAGGTAKSCHVGMGTDPAGRVDALEHNNFASDYDYPIIDTDNSTQSVFHIPFQLDL